MSPGASGRLEHADDRHRVEFVRERIECDGRRGVAEIDEVLAGQPVEQGAQDGQPADAGVEDTNRRGTRNRLVALQFAAHWGLYLPTVRSIADAAVDITPRHLPGPLPS